VTHATVKELEFKSGPGWVWQHLNATDGAALTQVRTGQQCAVKERPILSLERELINYSNLCQPRRKAISDAMPGADSAPHSGTSRCDASSDAQNDFLLDALRGQSRAFFAATGQEVIPVGSNF
jgi:hypothetical protein